MSHIDDAARLSRHRKAAEDEVNLTPGPYYPIHMNYQVEIGMNDEWLLAVAGQHREGDAKKLEALTRYLFSRSEDIEGIPMAYILTAVHRMLAAARIMEGEQG